MSTTDLLLRAGLCLLLVLLALPLLLFDNASIGLWLMGSLPLLLLAPGVWQRNRRSLQWLGFLLLFLFTQGVLQGFSQLPALRWLGVATTGLCLLLFCTAIVALRRNRRSPEGA